jgi:hypothetical protein
MNWRPISEYDAMKIKPLYCVFYVKEKPATRGEGIALNELIITSRLYGNREITLFIELPPPKD